MNDALKMQISAFVDGELPENESELLIRRLSQDAQLRQQVAHYLEIGRLVRKDRDVRGIKGLRSRVAEALGEERAPAAAEVVPAGPRFVKPVAGIAVAASVALVALLGLRQVVDNGNGTTPPGPAVETSAQSVTYTEPELDQQLREMHRIHTTTAPGFGGNGDLARLTTLELRAGELVQVEPDGHLLPADERLPEEQPPDDEASELAEMDTK